MTSITARKLSKENFDWPVGLFIIGYHILLLLLVPVYFFYNSPPLSLVVVSGILLVCTGISVTAGYHRLYSHNAYKTNPLIETILLFFGTMSTQGSALRWSYEHRIHHAFVDQDQDPYCIKKGFWYAHFVWMLFKGNDIEKKVVADLYRNKLVMFQHKYYAVLMVITNLIPTLLFGYLYQDYLASFLFVWGVRLFLSHHFAWFINSLAHFWGSKSFSQEHSAVDNYIICMVTWGEGYHNYHHTFANDYRNGIKWYHFDPTKWLIWGLSKIGMARNLRRMSSEKIAKQMIMERKNELLSKMETLFQSQKQVVEEKIHVLADRILEKIGECHTLLGKKNLMKKDPACCQVLYSETKEKVEALKAELKVSLKEWKKLSQEVLSTQVREPVI